MREPATGKFSSHGTIFLLDRDLLDAELLRTVLIEVLGVDRARYLRRLHCWVHVLFRRNVELEPLR